MHTRSGQNKSNVQAHGYYTGPHPFPEPSGDEKRDSSPKNNSNNSEFINKNNSNPLNSLLSGIFSDGKIDNDKIIIIALIVLLAKEGADIKLLMALGYILM
jgi:hypothetical protein